MNVNDSETAYHSLDFAGLPDELFTPETPVAHWLKHSSQGPFPSGSLGLKAKQYPIEFWPHLERIFGTSLYVALNVIPVSLLPLTLGWILAPSPWYHPSTCLPVMDFITNDLMAFLALSGIASWAGCCCCSSYI